MTVSSGGSFTSGIFWVNPNDFSEVGDPIDFHKHPVPHDTIARFGEVEVTLRWPDGRVEAGLYGPADPSIHVPAGVEHRIIATKVPARTWCMFLHRDPVTGQPRERFSGLVFVKPDV